MHRNNIFLLLMLLGMLYSCIKPYTPDVETAEKEKYVKSRLNFPAPGTSKW